MPKNRNLLVKEQDQPFPKEVKICGFLDANYLANPPCLTRHLVIPTGSGYGGTDTSNSDGKEPSFCVLLHGSLKVEKWLLLHSWGK